MANSVDPDQLASEEANWYGSTLFDTVCKYSVYLDSAWQGVILSEIATRIQEEQSDLGLYCLLMPFYQQL